MSNIFCLLSGRHENRQTTEINSDKEKEFPLSNDWTSKIYHSQVKTFAHDMVVDQRDVDLSDYSIDNFVSPEDLRRFLITVDATPSTPSMQYWRDENKSNSEVEFEELSTEFNQPVEIS